LNLSIGTIIISILNFLVLLWLLKLILYKPVLTMLDEREARIRRENEEIARGKEEAAALLAEYQKRLAEINAEAQRIINSAEHEGEQVRSEILAQAKAEAERILSKAGDEAIRERSRIFDELRNEMAQLVVAAASKIMGESMDDPRRRQMALDFIQHLNRKEIGELSDEAKH
jgi:F-type H+-transporting ATPase subunit b